MTKNQLKASFLNNISGRERLALQSLIDYTSVELLPEIWPLAAKKFGDIIALYNPHSQPEVKITYNQLTTQINQFAAGLQALGVNTNNSQNLPYGERVSL
ncbi:MAG: long-chain fatty acid--CoA ligase, partial [Dolichospermum sp.]